MENENASVIRKEDLAEFENFSAKPFLALNYEEVFNKSDPKCNYTQGCKW